MNANRKAVNMRRPLVVDLDGTFIHGDLLKQDLITYIGRSPIKFLQCAVWGVKGRAYIKARLADFALIDYRELVVNQMVADLVAKRRLEGSRVVLMTGSDKKHADRVAEVFGLFDEVVASSHGKNMVGSMKEAVLIRRFGKRGYDYVGNARQDLKAWSSAMVCYATNVSPVTRFFARMFGIKLVRLGHVDE